MLLSHAVFYIVRHIFVWTILMPNFKNLFLGFFIIKKTTYLKLSKFCIKLHNKLAFINLNWVKISNVILTPSKTALP